MFGLLNLNKPKGLTSRDAVNRVQWLVRDLESAAAGKRISKKAASKVGHAGTLDPIATGVLVVCVGPATRLIEYVQRMPKQYRGTFLLGRRSPSDDVELPAEELVDPPVPSEAEIAAALPAFTGEIQQVPPAFSAIKVGGEKSYSRARQGEEFELPPRPVTIHALEIVSYEYPELVLDIRCGSGTYIRSLGRDLAAALGTAAVMSELVRTAIGEFAIEAGVDPEGLGEGNLADALLPADRALAGLPRVVLGAAEVEELRHGRPVAERTQSGELALVDHAGGLVAIGQNRRGGLWPVRVFDVHGG